MKRHICPACGHEFEEQVVYKGGNLRDHAETPAELAELWCLMLTRTKFNAPRDYPQDVANEFDNMINNCGIRPSAIRLMMTAKGRDCGEPLWVFKQRFGLGLPLKAYASAGPVKPPETDEQRLRRVREQREQAERERRESLTPEQQREMIAKLSKNFKPPEEPPC